MAEQGTQRQGSRRHFRDRKVVQADRGLEHLYGGNPGGNDSLFFLLLSSTKH